MTRGPSTLPVLRYYRCELISFDVSSEAHVHDSAGVAWEWGGGGAKTSAIDPHIKNAGVLTRHPVVHVLFEAQKRWTVGGGALGTS